MTMKLALTRYLVAGAGALALALPACAGDASEPHPAPSLRLAASDATRAALGVASWRFSATGAGARTASLNVDGLDENDHVVRALDFPLGTAATVADDAPARALAADLRASAGERAYRTAESCGRALGEFSDDCIPYRTSFCDYGTQLVLQECFGVCWAPSYGAQMCGN
jgi:hypothetical protein